MLLIKEDHIVVMVFIMFVNNPKQKFDYSMTQVFYMSGKTFPVRKMVVLKAIVVYTARKQRYTIRKNVTVLYLGTRIA